MNFDVDNTYYGSFLYVNQPTNLVCVGLEVTASLGLEAVQHPLLREAGTA